jgi:hypothetical protein
MSKDLNKKPKREVEDIALRLATARSSDSFGQAVLPVTANVTAEEEVVDPTKERKHDLDAGS